jgi:uncharacterized protein YjbJ (UPF0337 family)
LSIHGNEINGLNFKLDIHHVHGEESKRQEESTMKSSTKDRAEGKFHQVKGKIKELAGKKSEDSEMESEGKVENLKGKVQEKIGQVEKVLGK